jgi:3-isopropylmalate/(R)-2-methylmalate dehydratase small subunit
MEPFVTLTSVGAPLRRPNVDTDVIIRIERLARFRRNELGPWAFESLRYLADGSENPDFVLNRPGYRDARILVGGENFGCGSSREDAVWAIAAAGLRAVLAPSFGDIFYGNCFQNGVLPIRLPAATIDGLMDALEKQPEALTIDLPSQIVTTAGGTVIPFEIEPLRKRMLVEGLDEIGLTLTRVAELEAFETRDRAARPWLYTAAG